MLSTLRKIPVGPLALPTKHGGSVALTDDQFLTVVTPLLGLPQVKHWRLCHNDTGPLHWLQSGEDPTLRLCLFATFQAGLDRDMELGSSHLADIGVEDASDIDLYTVVVLDRDRTPWCTNLRAPILIGRTTRLAKQVVLADARLPIQFFFRDLLTHGG